MFAKTETPLKNKIMFAIYTLIAGMVVLGVVGFTSAFWLQRSGENVKNSHLIIEDSLNLVGAAVDMETGMRGYLLAGKEGFLEPYNGGQENFFKLIEEMKKDVAYDSNLVKKLDDTKENISAWITDVTEPTIQLRRDIGDADTMNDLSVIVQKGEGKKYFDKFRAQIGQFIATEGLLLKSRQEKMVGELDPDVLQDAIKWVTHTYEVMAHAADIESTAKDMETGMRGYLLAGKEEFLELFNNGASSIKSKILALQQKVSDNPAQVGLLVQIGTIIGDWQQNIAVPMIELRRKIGNAKTMDDMADVVGEARGKKYFDKFRGQMKDFQDIMVSQSKSFESRSESTFNYSILLMLLLLVGSIGASIYITKALVRTITEPFKKVFKGLETFSEHELNKLSDSFNDIIRKLTGHSQHILSESGSIDKLSGGLSSNTTEQAAALEETSSSIEEMNGIVKNNSNFAMTSFDLSTDVKKKAVELSGSFTKIEESNAEIETLVKVIKEIGEKTRVIDEIVFQTKLLSFNASVEAERAGEHGRGFAVVAQEVGNLAALSGKAAVEISAIVKESTEKGLVIAKENANRVKEGSESMREAQEIIESVAGSSKKIVDASQEQSKGITQINHAIQEINNATQNTSSIAAQTSQSSKSLRNQALEMDVIVKELNRVLSGKTDNQNNYGQVVPLRPQENLVEEPNQAREPASYSNTNNLKRAVGETTVRDATPDKWEDL
ncbi:MAG: CHASE3 domain-containing protein [Oligoflexales bacterium]